MKFEDLVIKFRLPIIVVSILLTGILGYQMKDSKIDSDLKNFLPEHMSSRVSTDKIEDVFGSTEPVMLILKSDDVLNAESLTRIKKISKELNKAKEFDRVMSLFDTKNIKGEDGMMIVDPAVKRIPKSEVKRENLREEIKGNALAYGIVVSKDFKYALIMGSIKPGVNDKIIVDKMEEIIAKYPGEDTILRGGYPYIRSSIEKDVNGDFQILLPLALLVMLFFLYFSFKEKRGVILPFSVVILSIIFTMGLIPLLGWKINMLSVLAPIMLIAIANDYGIHFIANYQELNAKHPDWDMSKIVKESLKHLTKPIIITALTTIAGILGLLTHIMIPARQLGVVASIGIFFALVLSLLFIPAILSMLKKGKAIVPEAGQKKGFLDRLLDTTGTFVQKNPKRILIGSLIISLVFGLGTFRLGVDSDTENLFPEDHPIKVCSNIINDSFTGTKTISLLFEGDIKNPEVLMLMDKVGLELDGFPGVGKVISLSTIIHEMSKALNDPGEPFYDNIPDTRDAIAQYLELYTMNGDPEDFEQMVNFDFTQAVVTVQINNGEHQVMKNICDKIDEIVDASSFSKDKGGYALINMELSDMLIKGQIMSLVFAIGIVAILLMIIFRSFVAGIMVSIPLLMVIILLFGSMGFLGIKLDISSAMLSSILIGVGVDYTIHFLWRYKHELACGQTYLDAVKNTLTTSGRGITFNALSVIVGFTVLFISAFVSLKLFGFLIIVSIFTCLIAALVVIPAICIVLKPKFLENKK